MKKLLVLLCLLAFVATTNAATVSLYLTGPDAGVYSVYAKVTTPGDNDGIATAEVEIADAVVSASSCKLPRVMGAAGFTLMRSAAGANPIAGAQDPIGGYGTDSAYLIFGLGKQTVDMADQVTGGGTYAPAQVIGSSMLVGTFSVSSGTPSIDLALSDVAVFNTGVDNGPDGQGPVDTYKATLVPEPATMALLAFGGLALLRRRK